MIDEAAAIPLPLVKQLLGPYLVFMSSTVNGYEGTGRSLSLKLIQSLRTQSVNNASGSARTLREVSLEEPIRSVSLTDLVGTRLSSSPLWSFSHCVVIGMLKGIQSSRGSTSCYASMLRPRRSWVRQPRVLAYLRTVAASHCPPPAQCELYHVNRDTLFSYHTVCMSILQTYSLCNRHLRRSCRK